MCYVIRNILWKGVYFSWYMLQEIAWMITHLLRIHIFCATKVFNSRFIRRSMKWVYWAAAVKVIQYLIMVKYASTYNWFSRLIYSYLNLFEAKSNLLDAAWNIAMVCLKLNQMIYFRCAWNHCYQYMRSLSNKKSWRCVFFIYQI